MWGSANERAADAVDENLLSVLLGELPDLMKQVADFYFPDKARVLDVSYGNGSLSQRLSDVTGVDIDPGTRAEIIADSTNLPLEDGAFDAAIFDPPYLYGRQSEKLLERRGWVRGRSQQEAPSEFTARAWGTASELARVLVPGSIAVTKVADARYNGRLVLNHSLIIEAFDAADFKLRDLLVYVRGGTGVFKNTRSAQSAHGYFVVVEKPAQMQMEVAEVA